MHSPQAEITVFQAFAKQSVNSYFILRTTYRATRQVPLLTRFCREDTDAQSDERVVSQPLTRPV